MTANATAKEIIAPGTIDKPEKVKRIPLPRLFSFRLSDDDGKKWDEKIARSGMLISPFIRMAVIENATVVNGDLIRKTKKTVRATVSIDPDIRRRNFLLAQTSNNINQLAHRLNLDSKSDLVTPATYLAILQELKSISIEIKRGI